MFTKILVANDGSENAKKALQVAIELAQRYGAQLQTISVEEHLPHYAATVGEVLEERSEENTYFAKVAQEAKALAKAQGIELHTKIVPGHEVETIVKYVQEHQFDLLVIGFMGHSRVLGRAMGGSASNLTRLVPCTVLVVK